MSALVASIYPTKALPPGTIPLTMSALAPARERLTSTLFLAALFHGIVILGITFSAADEPSGDIPSLQVLLLADEAPNERLNPEAAYLAQRNQHGSGTTEKDVRSTSPAASLLPTDWLGVANGDGLNWRQALSGSPTVDLVASRSTRSDLPARQGASTPASAAESPLALIYTPPSPVIATSMDRTLTLRGKLVQEIEVSPDTQESRLAPYLDGWRRKVERLGSVKFPLAARRETARENPILEVVIRADGNLQAIVVRRSSGQKALDQAAIAILKLAAPFDAFPPALKQEFDQLRFAYEWQFIGQRISGTVRIAP
ncbi:MAG: TonB family protein [Candidatus Obscuribacterales bacterium]|nr:TonB family protein [Steroidobacteraceae bacterium]